MRQYVVPGSPPVAGAAMTRTCSKAGAFFCADGRDGSVHGAAEADVGAAAAVDTGADNRGARPPGPQIAMVRR
ncbi:hypothetical protein [Streptomyces sp. NPDC048527]|uniref:hypothetical protein n=1 Tax=Streptomyces sp. NPDC048527 TaxID=3365568 RepID=UPI00371B3A0B